MHLISDIVVWSGRWSAFTTVNSLSSSTHFLSCCSTFSSEVRLRCGRVIALPAHNLAVSHQQIRRFRDLEIKRTSRGVYANNDTGRFLSLGVSFKSTHIECRDLQNGIAGEKNNSSRMQQQPRQRGFASAASHVTLSGKRRLHRKAEVQPDERGKL